MGVFSHSIDCGVGHSILVAVNECLLDRLAWEVTLSRKASVEVRTIRGRMTRSVFSRRRLFIAGDKSSTGSSESRTLPSSTDVFDDIVLSILLISDFTLNVLVALELNTLIWMNRAGPMGRTYKLCPACQ